MASTSTSSIQKSFKYDVFLSFRDEDTRKNFVDHLYHALKQKNIYTYRDDELIKKGKKIDEELNRSIEESRLYVIVFSKNYASSSWCLDELVKIMECQKTDGHVAYPIFYDVEPSEVRKQSGTVGEAFAKHKDKECVGKWKEALRQAADLAGWELKTTLDGHEAMFIQKIVKEISLELRFSNLQVDKNLIGMKKRVEDVMLALEIDTDDVRMIGIKGMGGGGKTTLAKVVFDQISILYEGSSFVENVRESSKASSCGLKTLQKQVLSDVLNDPHIVENGVSDLKSMMKKMIGGRKVLLVLDDVDHIDQLEALAGEHNWFKPGSRVIITTREEQVLIAHRVPKNLVLDVNLLSTEEAYCLFKTYAFEREIPNHDFKMLSDQFVIYAAGLPLTIKVLGSLLHGRDELEWEDELERIKTIPLIETQKKLELSYNSLEDDRKEIFLDVACILKGWDKEKAIMVLESRGLHARCGLKVLEQKSLITISSRGCLGMHDHIEEMGKNMVRYFHPSEPYKHSRLWIEEEIEDILINNKIHVFSFLIHGTEATRCMSVQRIDPVIVMKGLQKMKEIQFLEYDNDEYNYSDLNYDNVGEDNLYLPESLQYLCWDGYPFTCLPRSFQGNNLIGLQMMFSNIDQLCVRGERKVLKKLKFIDFHICKLRTLDIGLSLDLERLNLERCWDLIELRMPTKRFKLKFLRLYRCKVKTLDLSQAQNLEKLNIVFTDLVELHMPAKSPRLKQLHLKHTGLKTLNLTQAHNLDTLHLAFCEDLVELHMPDKSLKLKDLILEYCKLETLNLKCALNLKSLYLKRCEDLRTLYIEVSSKLECLILKECYNLVEIHAPIRGLKDRVHIKSSGCVSLNPFLVNQGSPMVLVELHLTKMSLGIMCELHLDNNLHCLWFECIYKEPLPSLTIKLEKHISINLCTCKNLSSLLGNGYGLRCLRKLTLEGSVLEVLVEIDQLECLEELNLLSSDIEHLPGNICTLKHLKSLKLKSCWLLEQLPMDLGRLECLEELHLTDCLLLRDIPNSICDMKSLKYFHLPNCVLVEKLPEEIGRLKCLKELNIECTNISHLPESIFLLKGLLIIGSRFTLRSNGITLIMENSEKPAFYYI